MEETNSLDMNEKKIENSVKFLFLSQPIWSDIHE